MLDLDRPGAEPTISSDQLSSTPSRPRWWFILVAIAAGGALLVSAGRTNDRTGYTSPSGDMNAASPSPPTSAAVDASIEMRSSAEAVTERLVASVNRADSVRVIELLAPSLRAGAGGASEWPLLRGDLGWWRHDAGATLDPAQVTDFVRYFRTMPAGVLASDCTSEVVELETERVAVTCDYAAFGGVLGLVGEDAEIETAGLTVITQHGLVVDVRRSAPRSDAAWARFTRWVAEDRPDEFEQAFGWGREGPPTWHRAYSGATALIQAELAREYASLIGVSSLPIG